ncbi:adenosine kinase [Eilatimonas milleporae]|uniref:Sugar/nucleoside kinase (Ribokinase family) n=1 Tax=Eilatimonas milleporae TaxID=911205 RepID=A0A3M0CYH7_9PROT|nr:adenosine kinase [Eilatimonas milleporae]RMB12709.1 sugar/nucleoside kinase (ribokinase family) [Eilatimonas milleporae]
MTRETDDNPQTLDVLCMGNAIVDILARVDDAFLDTHERVKGAMTLVDEDTSRRLYDAMPPAVERSGGSAANTAAGVAMLGGRAGFIGKVRDDQLGTVFRHDITAVGVDYRTESASAGEATATSMILVTPDAQRTMNTYLGACANIGPEDVGEDQVASAAITYIEGYLWDRPRMKEAVLRGIDIAHANGRRIALTLSDSFCVDRFRAEFRDLIDTKVEILFANEAEICSLYEVDDFEAAAGQALAHADIAAVTRSGKGSVVLANGTRIDIPAHPATVEDTTGAGDLYAAGFLYGLTAGHDLETCGRIASMAAAEVISHLGARPEADMKAALKQLLAR